MTIWSMKASIGQDSRLSSFVTVQRVVLTGADLTVADVEAVARHGAEAASIPAARARMERSRAVVAPGSPAGRTTGR